MKNRETEGQSLLDANQRYVRTRLCATDGIVSPATFSEILCRGCGFFYRGTGSKLRNRFDRHANPKGDVGQRTHSRRQEDDEKSAEHPCRNVGMGSQASTDSAKLAVAPGSFDLVKELDE